MYGHVRCQIEEVKRRQNQVRASDFFNQIEAEEGDMDDESATSSIHNDHFDKVFIRDFDLDDEFNLLKPAVFLGFLQEIDEMQTKWIEW